MGRREGRFVAVTTEAARQSPERHFKFAHAWRFVCLAGSAFPEELPSLPIYRFTRLDHLFIHEFIHECW